MSSPRRRLAVYLYDRLAGHIQREGGTLSFAYEQGYLEQPRATPLSLSMPLTDQRYTNRLVEAHLRGLLPDSADVRRRWAAHFGLRERDTFGLVAAIGSDVAGGAVFRPDSESPDSPDSPGAGYLEPIEEAGIAERLRRLRADSADWLGDDEHWSLAGAQGKFTLRKTDSGWAIARGTEASTHIVKPGIAQLPAQALVEHVSMRAAALIGLDVAPSTYTEFDGQPAIVVERFDRQERDGRLVRIHQEDFCQTFGLDPSRKYEADQGPGVLRIADRLRDVTEDDSLARFGRAVIANYLLGAPDAHAKNYSLLLVGPAARLAPLYDVASGLTSERGGQLRFPQAAMSMGGERRFGDVRSLNWDRFARNLGLPADQIRDWVRGCAEALPDAVRDASETVVAPGDTRAQLGLLLDRVRVLAQLATRGLAEQTGDRSTKDGARRIIELSHPPED